MSDVLIKNLLELVKCLQDEGVGVVIGGGLSYYLRQAYMVKNVPPHYSQLHFESRSTQDIDVFLGPQIIVEEQKVNVVKNVLAQLGYLPMESARFFQFQKTDEETGFTVKIDLLAALPENQDQHGNMYINDFRIRPKACRDIHAYLTPEAATIDSDKVEIGLSDESGNLITVAIPSAYNFLILKLHAFYDRKDRNDDNSDGGRHHAFDIFATVCQMSEGDWHMAKAHYKKEAGKSYLAKACKIRKEDFCSGESLGAIRVRENKAYQQCRSEYDAVLDAFIKDLQDLFP